MAFLLVCVVQFLRVRIFRGIVRFFFIFLLYTLRAGIGGPNETVLQGVTEWWCCKLCKMIFSRSLGNHFGCDVIVAAA